MDTLVEILYNPYIPRLITLVDGRPISQYSKVVQFTDEDIWYWKDEILEIIHSEIRQDFCIKFTGILSDFMLLQSKVREYEFCKAIEWQEPDINMGLQKRLVMLNQIVKNLAFNEYKKTYVKVVCLFDEESKEFKEEVCGIEVKNSFCQVSVETEVGKISDISQEKYYIHITKDYDNGKKYLDNINSRLPKYLIVLNEGNGLKAVLGNKYIYEASGLTLSEVIFQCLLTMPLVKALRDCIGSLQRDKQNEIRKVYAMEPVIHIEVDSRLEEGRSNKINITYEPTTKNPPKITFRILDVRVADTNNLYVFGKGLGETILEAYLYGEKLPFFRQRIEVIRRKRVRNLVLDETEICIGEGDLYHMGVDYSPYDADNLDKMEWKTTNEEIASISSQGKIKARKEGECKIICTVENVSSVCRCVVKPYLEEIKVNIPALEEGVVKMEPFQEVDLAICLYPQNSIDSVISVKSSDYDIVNIVNGKLIAKNEGTARITLTNNTNRKHFEFVVVTEKKKINIFQKLFNS